MSDFLGKLRATRAIFLDGATKPTPEPPPIIVEAITHIEDQDRHIEELKLIAKAAARTADKLQTQVDSLESMKETIAFAVNHMPMNDDTYAFLCKALEEQRIAALEDK